jgi:hypothetical protein
LCTVAIMIVIRYDLVCINSSEGLGLALYRVWILQPYFSLMGVLASAGLFTAVAAVGGVTAGFLCTVAIMIVIRYDLVCINSIQEQQLYREWILQPYYSLTIDPDSIYQRITSLRLERHFRANHVHSN